MRRAAPSRHCAVSDSWTSYIHVTRIARRCSSPLADTMCDTCVLVAWVNIHRPCRPRRTVLTITDPRGRQFFKTARHGPRRPSDKADVVFTRAGVLVHFYTIFSRLSWDDM